MAIGWTYAFGDCSDEDTWESVRRALCFCSGRHDAVECVLPELPEGPL